MLTKERKKTKKNRMRGEAVRHRSFHLLKLLSNLASHKANHLKSALGFHVLRGLALLTVLGYCLLDVLEAVSIRRFRQF